MQEYREVTDSFIDEKFQAVSSERWGENGTPRELPRSHAFLAYKEIFTRWNGDYHLGKFGSELSTGNEGSNHH